MRFSLTALVRLAILLGMGSFVLAVGVAQLAPSGPAYWRATQPRLEAYNGFLFSRSDRYLRMLDPRTGQVADQQAPGNEAIAYGSISPWSDEEGRTELVGRWASQDGALSSGLCGQLGIVRISLPDGAVLDRIDSDVMPLGRPCWFPTPPSRVLFEGGNGKLYRLQFPDSRGRDDDTPAGGAQPQPLVWNCKPPGEEHTLIGDPVWLSDPRWKGRLLVSLNPLETHERHRSYEGARIWCLRLNADGSRVEEARRLTTSQLVDPAVTRKFEERMPNVVRTPDGRLLLAYLSRWSTDPGWSLKTVPIVADPASGQPVLDADHQETLADNCVPAFPSVSPDGRWIHALKQLSGERLYFERIPLVRPAPSRQAD